MTSSSIRLAEPPMDPITQWIETASQHHARGELGPAEQLYAQALARDPARLDARCGMAVLLSQTGRHGEALALYPREVVLQSGSTLLLVGLAGSLLAVAMSDTEATAPRDNRVTSEAGDDSHDNIAEAVIYLKKALEVDPTCPEAHNTLGAAYMAQGQILDAVLALRSALRHRPGYTQAYYNLGRALFAGDMPAEAIKAYDAALRIRPGYAQALLNKGFAQRALGLFDEAAATFRLAMTIRPAYGEAMHNLGVTLAEQGQVAEGVAWLRRAVDTDPQNMHAHSALVYLMEFDPASTPKALAAEQARWNQRHGAALAAAAPARASFSQSRDPHRKLRVGFVSPDFRGHAECRFVLPLLEHMDALQFEVHLYASVRKPDAVTERYRQLAHVWHDVREFSDGALARRIHADGIDILIDLTMHMEQHRLLTFARRPAPVQLSWLAYPGSTGLPTIDYHLTDKYLFPPDPTAPSSSGTERPLYLPDAWFCYQPAADLPPISPLPALVTGAITLGSLNSYRKISPQVLTLWARLLATLQTSGNAARLLLITPEGSHRAAINEIFASHGVPADCIEFTVPVPYADYIALCQCIDIALDPFPHAGATTTLDALCMGVPVLSLRGGTGAGRLGESVLTTANLPDWLADTPEAYIAKAVTFARDLPRLANLRATLRERVTASPLTNAPRFARHFEQALRRAWQQWCDAPGGG